MSFEEPQAMNHHCRLALAQVEEGILLLRGGLNDFSRLRIVFANPAVEQRLGLQPGSLVGVAFAEVFAEDRRSPFQRDWLSSDPRELFQGRYALRTLEGGSVEADWVIASSPMGGEASEPGHTVTLRWLTPSDATEEGDPEKEGLSGDHAFELNKADTIAHIARGIVHDFNNSLTAIQGHLEGAMREVEEGAPVRESLEQAMDAAVTTSGLCRRLLSYAKGRRSSKRACQVHDVVHQAVAITGLGSNVNCEQLIDEDIWPILADDIEIVQVINNLLVNAQQAMPDGGTIALVGENVPIEGHSPTGLPPGDYVALTVRDRGVGIPDEQRDRIFEALYTTKPNGSGLGLATCAQIVSAHEGYIDVHSVPNRGSEFIVYLPAAPEESSSALETGAREGLKEEGLAAGAAQTNFPTQLKILVVEDQIGISKIAETYLQKLGHVVVCVVSGEQALVAHREARQEGDPFDLGIIDMTLPGGMNGEDTFRELCHIDPHLVGIATSGSMDRDSLPIYQQKGFATILPKPFPLQMLEEVVGEAMLFHVV